jgi:hypothetical protein
MELLDQALIRLYHAGSISLDMVYDFCNDRDEVAKLLGDKEDHKKIAKEAVLGYHN